MGNRDFVRIYRKILQRPLTVTAILFLLTFFLSLQTNEGLVLGEFRELKNCNATKLNFSPDEPAPIEGSVSQYFSLSVFDKISAQAVIVLDPTTHTTLYAENPDARLPPASLTKVATALVVLQNMDLNQIATVPENISEKAQGSLMGLLPGEKISVENLLWGTLLPSGNDAAHTLAVNFPGGYDVFVGEMNKLAIFLHLSNTHFTNVMGFDDNKHYSSAYDLAILSEYALRNPLFAEVVGTAEKTVVSEHFFSPTTDHQPPTTHQQWHQLLNTNELLGQIKEINGVKTGYTQKAGECMIVSLYRNGKTFLIVLLGSKERLSDAGILIKAIK
ncbi:MAG: D-alanyl-D-alanine carboxypeptidase [Candidatus Cloacimonetes bacterium]|nr:D-alanyl-D-alanine carboxypeptidase [Candidatus Cloacimonadota bacterium]